MLGVLFSHITQRSQIGPLLRAYEEIRYPRTTYTQLSSQLNQRIFHYEDGPEQEARDKSMRESMQYFLGEQDREKMLYDSSGNANQWADQQKNKRQFNYDSELDAENWWEENKHIVLSN